MKHVKLFEAFLNEASGKLTTRQIKKIDAWKDSPIRVWYGETYNWLWKNASKIVKAKSVEAVLKFKVGSFKSYAEFPYVSSLGISPETYTDTVAALKGVDTSNMGYSGKGYEFKAYLGEYPGRSSGSCGMVYVDFAYDGKKDELIILNLGIRNGFSCDVDIKTVRATKDELAGFYMMENGKLRTRKELDYSNRSDFYWGISDEQTWEEIEATLTRLYKETTTGAWK